MALKTWEVGTRLHKVALFLSGSFTNLFMQKNTKQLQCMKITLVAGLDNVVYIIMLIEGIFNFQAQLLLCPTSI